MKDRLKNRIQRSLYDSDYLLDRDLIVVAQTGRYMSFNKLTHKLKVLNSKVNKSLFGSIFNEMPMTERVAYYYFNQNSPKLHTHSHLLLKIPDHLDRDNVLDVMNNCWGTLQDNVSEAVQFKIYRKKLKDLDTTVSNVIYSSRQLKDHYKDNEFGMF
jgi:hypothetical protein